jgi:hypothetical protein
MPDSRRPFDAVDVRRTPPAAALSVGAALLAAGLVTGWAIAGAAPGADPCALPLGLDLRALGDEQRDRVAERAMLCTDLEHGRISAAEYRANLAALDRRPEPAAPLPEVVWASRVIDHSSQYQPDSWSSRQVLGPPDAPSGGADSPNAWASSGADTGPEFLEVAFPVPVRMNGIEIVESHNPGAVSAVELLLAGGERSVVYTGPAAPRSHALLRRRVDFACTDEAVVGVRVIIDSHHVPGWNEIDAIGGRPCRAGLARQ